MAFLDREMREKRVDLAFHHLRRVAQMAGRDEPLDPKAIGLLGSSAVVTRAQRLAQPIEQLWPPWGRGYGQRAVGSHTNDSYRRCSHPALSLWAFARSASAIAELPNLRDVSSLHNTAFLL
jgi:hypothetical protein